MAKGDDIEERLIDLAVAVIRLCEALPGTPSGRHVAGQLLRSGTSPAPNYAEARGAESRADFVHKCKVALKELNETRVWLKIAERSDLARPERVDGVLSECLDLARVLGASIRTARANTASGLVRDPDGEWNSEWTPSDDASP